MSVFIYICDYLSITPKEFFDTENNDPEKSAELYDVAKHLDSEQLEHLIAIAKGLRQHRTKNALRLSTTSACSFSVILHKTHLITVRLLARFAHSDEKIDGTSAVLSLCGFALHFSSTTIGRYFFIFIHSVKAL